MAEERCGQLMEQEFAEYWRYGIWVVCRIVIVNTNALKCVEHVMALDVTE